jgi:hypothetical protein
MWMMKLKQGITEDPYTKQILLWSKHGITTNNNMKIWGGRVSDPDTVGFGPFLIGSGRLGPDPRLQK